MTASHKSPDSDLFAELMEDVTPLKQNDKVSDFDSHLCGTLRQIRCTLQEVLSVHE